MIDMSSNGWADQRADHPHDRWLLGRPPEAGDDGSECGAAGGLSSQHRHTIEFSESLYYRAAHRPEGNENLEILHHKRAFDCAVTRLQPVGLGAIHENRCRLGVSIDVNAGGEGWSVDPQSQGTLMTSDVSCFAGQAFFLCLDPAAGPLRSPPGTQQNRAHAAVCPVPAKAACERRRGANRTRGWLDARNANHGILRGDNGPQSGLMLAARITLPHFSVSSAMNLPNSAGELANAV
jgi:hypothetical protein